ncbi:MAG: Panacea domain-containing protein [Pseudomonadota bacterium]
MSNYNLTWGANTPAVQHKLSELLLYVAEKAGDLSDFGSTKINKTLYHADMNFYREHGRSITGAQYHRIQKGPVPKHILVVERALSEAGALELVEDDMTHRRIAKRPADISTFTDEEITTVDKEIQRLAQMTAGQVSDDSHDIRWRALTHQDLVPYEFAFLNSEVTDADKKDAATLADRFGW